MATAPVVTDTPTGFVSVSPWSTIDKTLVLDLKAFLASDRLQRNILARKLAVRSNTNIHNEITFTLPQVTSGPNSSYTQAVFANSVAVVVVSNRNVSLSITNTNGTLLMGNCTIFCLTANITSLTLTNVDNTGNAEVNLILI